MADTICVTGATGLLGRAICLDLLHRGYQVIAMVRSEEKFNGLRDHICSHANEQREEVNARLSPVYYDYSANQSHSLEPLLDQLKGKSISGLVNNARSLDGLKVGEDGKTRPDVFVQEFQFDVVFPYQLTMAMIDMGLRTVVNVGSMYGVVAPNPALYGGSLKDSPIQYGVAKAALHHLSKELAVRLASQGIRVNTVAFGGIEGRVDDAFKDRYSQLVPMRRMLKVSEVTGPVAFLISDDSSAITGQSIAADGGWSVW
jgi:NAD(P)-dependent dehydrogenase (short-subunit alcohol dehydrogenase family)